MVNSVLSGKPISQVHEELDDFSVVWQHFPISTHLDFNHHIEIVVQFLISDV